MSQFEEIILAEAIRDAQESDFWRASPEWAQDVINRAADPETGVCSEVPWTAAAMKHFKSALSCVAGVNRRMSRDIVYQERNGITIGEVKRTKRRKVHGRVNKPSESKKRLTTNPKIRPEDKSAGKASKGKK